MVVRRLLPSPGSPGFGYASAGLSRQGRGQLLHPAKVLPPSSCFRHHSYRTGNTQYHLSRMKQHNSPRRGRGRLQRSETS